MTILFNAKYLIISSENYCVFTMAQNPFVAHALIECAPTDCFMIASQRGTDNHENAKSRDTFYKDIWLFDYKDRSVKMLPNKQISEAWRHDQEIIRARQLALAELFATAEIANSIRSGGLEFWPSFGRFATDLINNSDASTDSYHDLLVEYAELAEKPVKEVYQDLKLKIESVEIQRFKIMALIEKFKTDISQMQNMDEFPRLKERIKNAFWGNAGI